MPLSESEAVAIAKKTAEAENWPWKDPVHATLSSRDAKRPTWEIFTNSMGLGAKVRVLIHATTGDVLEKGFIKR